MLINEKKEELMLQDDVLNGESKNLEFKAELPSKSEKYIKTVVAFSNSGGGRIIFGVEDGTGKIIGISEEKVFGMMDTIANSISDSCVPLITPQITMQTIEDKVVIVVQVFPGSKRPYFIKSLGKENGTFVRIGATTRPVDEYLLKELEFEGDNRYFDQTYAAPYEPVSEKRIKKLCDEMYQYALEHCRTEEEKSTVKPLSKSKLLQWGLLVKREDKYYPTNAFLLLTDNPFPQAIIQCGYFKGSTREIFVDRKEYTGAIHNQLDEAYNYVLRNINLGAEIEGLYRRDFYELPTVCIREMICNAVCHRSYLHPGNIQVAVFDERVEVTSPGTLIAGLTMEDLKNGISVPRNRGLANAFAYMKIIEHWGSGVPKMIKSCKEAGVREPEFIEMGSGFRINLYRTNQNVKKTIQTQKTIQRTIQTNQTNQDDDRITLTKKDKEILRVIDINPKLTQKEMANELGWSLERVKYYTNKLKKQGILRRVGTSHKGKWESKLDKNLW